ncbi:hypothetical protein BV378_02150 [Nostoc sp. RF31YmG]|jgi:uncharacterized membrane protein|nr:hypothetical protein BV378_02150 [Nostoc sp. RF31YmG]
MLGITAFGMLHTVISLIGMGAGFVALFARFRIGRDTRAGRVFVLFTALSALTGLFIYHHGGFGKPHVLSLATLAVLALGMWQERRGAMRWQGLRVASLLYTVALFFHFIPGLTETFTRLPVGAPLFDSPDDPQLAMCVGVIAVCFVGIGIAQWRHLRRLAGHATMPASASLQVK